MAELEISLYEAGSGVDPGNCYWWHKGTNKEVKIGDALNLTKVTDFNNFSLNKSLQVKQVVRDGFPMNIGYMPQYKINDNYYSYTTTYDTPVDYEDTEFLYRGRGRKYMGIFGGIAQEFFYNDFSFNEFRMNNSRALTSEPTITFTNNGKTVTINGDSFTTEKGRYEVFVFKQTAGKFTKESTDEDLDVVFNRRPGGGLSDNPTWYEDIVKGYALTHLSPLRDYERQILFCVWSYYIYYYDVTLEYNFFDVMHRLKVGYTEPTFEITHKTKDKTENIPITMFQSPIYRITSFTGITSCNINGLSTRSGKKDGYDKSGFYYGLLECDGSKRTTVRTTTRRPNVYSGNVKLPWQTYVIHRKDESPISADISDWSVNYFDYYEDIYLNNYDGFGCKLRPYHLPFGVYVDGNAHLLFSKQSMSDRGGNFWQMFVSIDEENLANNAQTNYAVLVRLIHEQVFKPLTFRLDTETHGDITTVKVFNTNDVPVTFHYNISYEYVTEEDCNLTATVSPGSSWDYDFSEGDYYNYLTGYFSANNYENSRLIKW